MRYKNTKIVRDKSGTRYYRPTIVPNIPLSDNDLFIYPKFGERLDTLAFKFYKDSNLWWVIAKANELTGGTLVVDSEKQIRIPGNISRILENVERSN